MKNLLWDIPNAALDVNSPTVAMLLPLIYCLIDGIQY